MFAAPPSWRVTTSRIGASRRAASTGRELSPGTPNARSAPCSTSWSTRTCPPLRLTAPPEWPRPECPRSDRRGSPHHPLLEEDGGLLGLRLVGVGGVDVTDRPLPLPLHRQQHHAH